MKWFVALRRTCHNDGAFGKPLQDPHVVQPHGSNRASRQPELLGQSPSRSALARFSHRASSKRLLKGGISLGNCSFIVLRPQSGQRSRIDEDCGSIARPKGASCTSRFSPEQPPIAASTAPTVLFGIFINLALVHRISRVSSEDLWSSRCFSIRHPIQTRDGPKSMPAWAL